MKTFFVCLQSNSKGRAFGYLLFVGKTSAVDHYCRAFRLIVNNIDLQYRKSFTGALKEFLAVVSLQWQSFFFKFCMSGTRNFILLTSLFMTILPWTQAACCFIHVCIF